jgi:hypothetical protein
VFFFAQSLSTTAHALFPVPAWRVGDGASASATRILYWRQWRFGGDGIQEGDFADQICRKLKIW